jgi:hypothetical protein
MPRLQELIAMLGDHPYHDSQFMSGESGRRHQRDWIQGELRQPPFALDMNVRRLGAFVAKKEEPVRPNSRNSWHLPSSRRSIRGMDT